MKKIKNLSNVILILLVVLSSCQKTKETEISKQSNLVLKSDPPPTFYTYFDVSSALVSDGWSSSTLPSGFIPEFSNYNSIVCFTKGTDYTYLYRYTDLNIANGETEKCTNKWNPGEMVNGVLTGQGCYNEGTQCRVVLKDANNPTGGVNVICCN